MLATSGLACLSALCLMVGQSEPEVWTGGCLCGAVRFEVRGTALGQTVCHCAGCRRASGAASVPWLTVRSSDYRVVQGKVAEVRAKGCGPDTCDGRGGARGFCAACGTPFLFVGDDRRDREVDIAIGALDHPERCRPTKEFEVEQRLPWVKPID